MVVQFFAIELSQLSSVATIMILTPRRDLRKSGSGTDGGVPLLAVLSLLDPSPRDCAETCINTPDVRDEFPNRYVKEYRRKIKGTTRTRTWVNGNLKASESAVITATL